MMCAIVIAATSFAIVQGAMPPTVPRGSSAFAANTGSIPWGSTCCDRGFFGRCSDARRGAKQTAYQVLVASTPEKLAADQGDLWDSGKIPTDQSTQVVYAGMPLAVADAVPLESAAVGRRGQGHAVEQAGRCGRWGCWIPRTFRQSGSAWRAR